jgi:hypothetical protein
MGQNCRAHHVKLIVRRAIIKATRNPDKNPNWRLGLAYDRVLVLALNPFGRAISCWGLGAVGQVDLGAELRMASLRCRNTPPAAFLRAWLQSRYRGMAHIEAAPDLRQCFTGLPSCDGFFDLMGSERGLPSEANTTSLSPLPPFIGSRSD